MNATRRLYRGWALVIAAIGAAPAAHATLDAALAFSAATVNVGQGVVVSLTVTNTGAGDALNLVPQISLAGPAVVTAPTPLTATQLGAGDQVTFQWTLSPNGGGTIAVTANATAAGPDVSPTTSGSVSVPGPTLDARLNALKTTVTVGQGVQLTLTVTNTGGSAATNVKAAAWSSTVTGTGAAPAAAGSLAAGAKTTFGWTATPTAAQAGQTIVFTASATADGLVLSPQSSVTITVQSAPAVTAKLVATSQTISGGGKFLVILTVSNSGQASAIVAMTTTAWAASVAGVTVTPYAASAPVTPATIASGATVSFTWTVTAKGVTTGLVLSNTLFVTDANGGPALASQWLKTNTVSLVGLGALKGGLAAFRSSTALGQPVQFVLTLTNTGGTTVENITAVLWADGAGTAISGPSPASLAALAPGANAAFTWTATPPDSGPVKVHATAFGFTGSVTGAIEVDAARADAELPGIPAADVKTAFVFPAPARDRASIGYTMASSGTVRIRVYNEAGQLAATVEEAKPAGVQSSALTTSRLAPGVYYFLLTRTYDSGGSDKADMRKFVVVH